MSKESVQFVEMVRLAAGGKVSEGSEVPEVPKAPEAPGGSGVITTNIEASASSAKAILFWSWLLEIIERVEWWMLWRKLDVMELIERGRVSPNYEDRQEQPLRKGDER